PQRAARRGRDRSEPAPHARAELLGRSRAPGRGAAVREPGAFRGSTGFMRERTHVLVLAFAAVVAGLFLFYYKVTRLGLPLTPGAQTEVWTVESHLSFRGNGGPAKATLTLPVVGPKFGILSENFVSRGYGLNTADVNGHREAQWAIRRARGS